MRSVGSSSWTRPGAFSLSSCWRAASSALFEPLFFRPHKDTIVTATAEAFAHVSKSRLGDMTGMKISLMGSSKRKIRKAPLTWSVTDEVKEYDVINLLTRSGNSATSITSAVLDIFWGMSIFKSHSPRKELYS